MDLDAAEWRIPAARMKAKTEHRIPLSDAAVAMLRDIRPANPHDAALVFPSPQAGKQLSDMSLLRCLEVTGLKGKATVHGFRSSFRDWAGEKSGCTRDVIEMALAHQVGSDVERAYARSTLFDQRRNLMDAWGRYVS